jgi:hypothetical protein
VAVRPARTQDLDRKSSSPLFIYEMRVRFQVLFYWFLREKCDSAYDMSLECPNLSMNLQGCACTSTECPRKGLCCDCVRNHREQGNLPACLKP